MSLRLPNKTCRPSRFASTPRPVSALNPRGSGRSALRSWAAVTMACASGCSDERSTLAANRSTSASSKPGPATMSVSAGLPQVIVPVLSSTIASSLRAACRESPPRKRIPCSAPLPMPTVSDVGVARPSAHGQAMISTVTPTITAYASAGVGPRLYQPAKAPAAMISTAGTKMPDTWSTVRWIGSLVAWASWTMRTMLASAVSLPTLVARNLNAPDVLIVAPMTASPVVLSTGSDSPVTIDSSMLDSPSTITPSTGTFSPGRTRRMSLTMTSSTGISRSTPSRMTRAVLACSPTSFLIASEERPLAFTSSARPSVTSATTTALTS